MTRLAETFCAVIALTAGGVLIGIETTPHHTIPVQTRGMVWT